MRYYINAYINLKVKDVNSVLVESISNIKNKVVLALKKNNLLLKTSSRRE